MSTTVPTLATPGQPQPSVKTWLMAARPKTLTAGSVPVVVGTALAFAEGVGRWLPAIAAFVGAVLIQIGTNFVNDYYDFKKGADTAERLGPTRVTQSGLISPRTVMAGALVCFGLATLVGVYLVAIAGWPILVVGLASLLCGYAYTGGPYPLGYHGLGDLFVLLFFGFAAVAGTYFVQAGMVSTAAWWAAVPVGGLGTGILVVNNLRDATTDVKAGKRTLVVRFGSGFGKAEYVLLLALSYGTPVALLAMGLASPWVLLPFLSLPLAVSPLKLVLKSQGAALNPALGGTAKLQLVFGVLFAVGLYLR
ncbi:1,4-dihydroxy-2-naphthoate polyprenyltransferase [Corallococcus sp. H22C18031201]|uniref:1,4-dihydroxy-2-naphthoate polyprenyltransferase n=1 Tax=Citreicoccus inhibens TaxID=2849499 RepID=UPI000E743116|nr:1,4-dihydroxy-2-naphthoate polyprenyltransferase [Citreicoccus inhibens]MBU8897058.1 1,4-dihydroxy-2-naphthoate polyprenyltransferase [Citreicoccus inhibens]RJS19679.1 1,4-dihydroxy-2-naphthoate polyprenyltransferase [Corallococcus sp. H22C18031201]